ncbi:MAG: glycosyltransferase family 2 protein [Planctomycetes bacterium]|nr:glycosyltransferase family 2 protein [Planctomycetota bacterium]
MKPRLSILVVNYRSWFECVQAVRSFSEHRPHHADGSPMEVELILVDNASPEQDEAAIAELRELIAGFDGGQLILHDENGGYSKGMNLALKYATGDWILVSNPDVLVKTETIDRLLRAMEGDESIGAGLPEIYWDEGLTARLPPNILPTIRDLIGLALAAVSRRWLYRYSRKRTRGAVDVWDARGDVDMPMLSGCFFLMRKTFIDEIDFFDERFPLYYEDTDLSRRVQRAGKRVVQIHGCPVVHLYNRSGQVEFSAALERYWTSRRRYYRKWYGLVGQWVYDAVQRFLRSNWAEKRKKFDPYPDLIDIGSHCEKPVLKFDRSYDRVLIEFALDPYFYLAGGAFGSGDRWCPEDSMFKGFGPTTYYFRVVDVRDPSQRVIGVYRYTHVSPQVFRPMEVDE